jgi:hypothetical protein
MGQTVDDIVFDIDDAWFVDLGMDPHPPIEKELGILDRLSADIEEGKYAFSEKGLLLVKGAYEDLACDGFISYKTKILINNMAIGKYYQATPDSKPKPGYVYLAVSTHRKLYKIGNSVNPQKRIDSLRGADPSILLVCGVFSEDCRSTERMSHHYLRKYRVKREWFDLGDDADSLFLESVKGTKYVSEDCHARYSLEWQRRPCRS